jgi:hypothetical protein
MTDLRDDIASLEERIEALRQTRERCRKISFAAKIALYIGAFWLVLTLTTLVPFAVTPFFAAIAVAIGSIVLLGSNKTTWEQTEEDLRKAEAARAQFIGGLNLRIVGEEKPTSN